PEALDGPAAQDVAVDDLGDVGNLHVPIPHRLGVDDDVGAVLALVEAAGGVRAHRRLEVPAGDLVLEALAEGCRAVGVAASARMAGVARVGADEDVVLEGGQALCSWAEIIPARESA